MIRLLLAYTPCAVITRARRAMEVEVLGDWQRWDVERARSA